MWTVGTLFVVSLGMSLKDGQTLQMVFKPYVLKFSICFWRHVGATSQGKTGESTMSQSAVHRFLTLLFMGRQQNLTPKNVGQGLASKWSMILKVTNVCKFNKRRRDVDKIKMSRCRLKTPGESALVKRGANAVADKEES